MVRHLLVLLLLGLLLLLSIGFLFLLLRRLGSWCLLGLLLF